MNILKLFITFSLYLLKRASADQVAVATKSAKLALEYESQAALMVTFANESHKESGEAHITAERLHAQAELMQKNLGDLL